jgi:hypothetical protein
MNSFGEFALFALAVASGVLVANLASDYFNRQCLWEMGSNLGPPAPGIP